MNKRQLQSVMTRATNVKYSDPFEFYLRIIRTVMAIVGDGNHLQPREREILAVMCLVSHEGGDLNDNALIMYRMHQLGLNVLQSVTFRNYKVKLKARRWLMEDSNGDVQLNAQLQKGIVNKGLAVRIFLEV